jgi:hypothetical protein
LGEFVMTLDYWGNIGSVLDKLSDIFVQIRTIKFEKKGGPGGGGTARAQQRAWAAAGRTKTMQETQRHSDSSPHLQQQQQQQQSNNKNANPTASPSNAATSANQTIHQPTPNLFSSAPQPVPQGFKMASVPSSTHVGDRTAFTSSANANNSTSSSTLASQQLQQQPGGPLSPRHQPREPPRNNFLVRNKQQAVGQWVDAAVTNSAGSEEATTSQARYAVFV